MQVYYEIPGQGKPMVLLHGGITAFEGFGTNILAQGVFLTAVGMNATVQ
jgi:hypothetical protein